MALRTIEEIVERAHICDVLEIQTEVIHAMCEYFKARGFKWMLPVMLSFVTDPLWPEPAGNHIMAPEIEVYGKKMKLMHSMILHKQIAVSMGLERIFILSPNIRIEKPERDDGNHAYEFTQLDFEIAHARMQDVMGIVEECVCHTIERVRELECLKNFCRELPRFHTPFRIYTYDEVLREYGGDRELSKAMIEPVWITDISREFYDRSDESMPGHTLNYDLILPEGYGEVLSGGEREYEYEKIVIKLENAGLSVNSFWPYLEIAKRGMLKPSAGGGIGVERFVKYITGMRHIEDVQVFPRVPGVPSIV
ncbi:MAG: asparagine synthetase A [Thermoplasmata archaeon]